MYSRMRKSYAAHVIHTSHILLDVREPVQFQMIALPGAFNTPLAQLQTYLPLVQQLCLNKPGTFFRGSGFPSQVLPMTCTSVCHLSTWCGFPHGCEVSSKARHIPGSRSHWRSCGMD